MSPVARLRVVCESLVVPARDFGQLERGKNKIATSDRSKHGAWQRKREPGNSHTPMSVFVTRRNDSKKGARDKDLLGRDG